MSNDALIRELMGVIERNTVVIGEVVKAVMDDAAASERMATEVRGLRSVITATQKKIGGELGPLVDRAKSAAAVLHHEAAEAVKARDNGRT